MSDDNENNLVQKREDRRTLEKMRRKLATSGHMGKNNVSMVAKSPAPQKKNLRIWPFAAVVIALLVGVNFVLRTQEDKVTAAMGVKSAAKPALAPPAGASLDEQARFWAYAAYDIPKLKARFTVPKGVVLDRAVARQNLERLLPENLGQEVRNEIFTLQQNAPPTPVNGKKPVTVTAPAAAPKK